MNKPRIKYALFVSSIFIALLWLIYFWQSTLHLSLYIYGVSPRHFSGLKGIFFAPFIHANIKHLYSNSIALFFLLTGLFYFYPLKAWKILVKGWLLTYFLVWLIGRESYHIGASGIVYMLASFHVFAGIFSGRKEMLAISLLVIFLYGSAIWGMIPSLAYEVSWEAHASGYFTGFILALGEIKSGSDKKTTKKYINFSSEPDLPIDFDYDYKE